MAPKNVVEAMLAVQMIASHEASLLFLRRATLDDQSTEGIDANVLRATRLMRVFAQQVEAMQKLKGKAIQQTLTVEQVNVHQGGQAIVGSVNTSKKEEHRNENYGRNRAHPKSSDKDWALHKVGESGTRAVS
jgi:hypothetical protein